MLMLLMIFDERSGSSYTRKATSLMFWWLRNSLVSSKSSLPMISRKFSFTFSCSVSGIIRQIYYLYCSMLRILPCLYVARTKKMGNGIFTSERIKANTIVEVSPVIVMEHAERLLLD